MPAIAGRVMPIMKGQYNPETTYEPLDFVTYDNALWGCIKQTKGNVPSEGQFWKKIIDGTVSDASSLGGETAEAWQEKIDSIQTTSRATLSQAGWYRVAEYVTNNVGYAQGHNSNGCILIIKRNSQGMNGEIKHILLTSTDKGQEFYSISKGGSHYFTKCRYTYEGTNAYLEVYYTGVTKNGVHFTVLCGEDIGFSWKAITPTLTEETVDGVTVTTTYDIPANASPVTSVDLANYLPLSGGKKLELSTTEADSRELIFKNLNRKIAQYLYASGTFTIYDETNGKAIMSSTADGTNTFNGTSTGNLALKGNGQTQKITDNIIIPFALNSTYADNPLVAMEFKKKDVAQGYLGFNGKDKPVFKGMNTGIHELLHTGNSAKVLVSNTPLTEDGVIRVW